MKTGRRPKPSAVKKAAGNPGKRPLNNTEPKPAVVNLPCPPQLEGVAREEWDRIAPELARLGILTKIDEKALLGYCQAWSRWVDAETNLRKYGAVIKAPSGYPIQNPYLTIANNALDQMRRFMVEFGMTPSSRSNIHVAPSQNDDKENPFAELAAEPLTIN